MSKRTLKALAFLVFGVLVLPSLLFAQSKALPPFTIKAEKLTSNLKGSNLSLVYEGNVILTSKQNNTKLTCQRLQTNAASLKSVTTIEARGRVNFSTEIPGSTQDAPRRLVQGTAEFVKYSLQVDQPVVSLLTVNGVKPKVIISNLAAKDEPPLVVTGDEIDLNMETGVVTGTHVLMSNEEEAQ